MELHILNYCKAFRIFDAKHLKRRALFEHILTNQQARAQLEAIIHPYVFAQLAQKLEICPKPVIVELQVMHQRPDWADVLIGIQAKHTTLIQRMVQKRGLTETQAKQAISVQDYLEPLPQHVDFLLNTDSDANYQKDLAAFF